MKRSLPFLLLTLCVSTALAEPPEVQPQVVQSLVQRVLLQPVAKAESKRKRFSRMAPVSVERRVRVLDAIALTDARGNHFVRFAVDARSNLDDDLAWNSGAFVGCVYPEQRKVFVQQGEGYVPASDLSDDPQPIVCRPAPAPTDQVAELAI
jgi:hypothetical protein